MTQMTTGLEQPLLLRQTVSDSIAVKNRRICYITLVALCVICITVIIIVGLGLFVLVPRIMQNELKKSSFRPNFISITQPTDHGFSIAIDASLSLSDSYVVYTKPATVELFYGQSIVTEIRMDGMKLNGSVNVLLNSTSMIRDENAFAKFTRDLVVNPSVEIGLRSYLDVIPVSNLFGNLTQCSVIMEKKMKLIGFGGINPTVKSFDIVGGDDSAMHITSSFDLMNPTIFALDPIGVLTFDLFSDSVHIGKAVSSGSWSIAPGLNQELSILGTVAPSSEDEITKVAEIIQDLSEGKNVTLAATSSPPYSSEAIYAPGLANITVEFAIPSNLASSSV